MNGAAAYVVYVVGFWAVLWGSANRQWLVAGLGIVAVLDVLAWVLLL